MSSSVTIPKHDVYLLCEFLANAADCGLVCTARLEPCGWVIEVQPK